MKKKCLLIFVGIILVLVAAGTILLPKRIELYDAINDNIETLGAEGKMFDAYDVTDDSLVQVETDYLTMGVPQDCSLGDNQIMYDYTNDDESVYVGISQSVREEKIAFFNSGYTDKSKIFDIVYSLDDLRMDLKSWDTEFQTVHIIHISVSIFSRKRTTAFGIMKRPWHLPILHS